MSVNYNLISATLEDEVHASIITDLKAIEAKMPWAITLPTAEMRSMRGIGLKSIDFINKSFEYAAKNPELLPQYLNMAEFEKDAKLLKQLQVLMQHLVPLTHKLKDTRAIVAFEAYNAARSFYQHLKNASNSNIPGTSAMVKELGKRFHVVKSATPKPEESSSSKVKSAAPEVKKDESPDATTV
ncbi:MAG TPA: hypothetical protein VK186_04040 [Candidatus Deferrimicrobium sp.]|nr:hypothetical protein [Candidatus Deferrimicrobium sp.]